MGLYSYTCDACGTTTELQMGMKEEHPPSVECPVCKGKAVRDMGADLRSRRHHGPRGWPLESEALAVLPSEVAEFTEDARKRGVPTDFNPESGAPILRGRGHRKRYCETYGFFDRDGGYGDAQKR